MYSRARRIGIDTAMMVTALSAAPKIRRFTLSTSCGWKCVRIRLQGLGVGKLTHILTSDGADRFDFEERCNACAVTFGELVSDVKQKGPWED